MFDSSFEIKFSQLASARLQEMVPSLGDYKIGFQLIEKNEDDTKGIGVMAFLINNTWVYIPAFFLSGKLKLPCLYIKNYDIRTPLNDSWVSYIKSNELENFGALVPMDTIQNNEGKADLLNLIGKQGSEKNDFLNKEEVKRMFSARPCSNTSITRTMRDGMNKKAFVTLLDTMKSDNEFANAIFKYYAPTELYKTASYLDSLEVEVAKPPVRVLTKESAESSELSDIEKTRLFKEGSVIKDDRKETSLVYKRDDKPATGFSSPDKSGFYEVLMSDGTTKDCIIVFPHDFKEEAYPSHHGRRQLRARCAIILKDKPKEYVTTSAVNVMTRNRKKIEESNIKGTSIKIKDNLNRSKLAEMKANTLMLVDASGNAYTLDSSNKWPKIYFTNRAGKLHVRQGTLMIPNDVLAFTQVDSFDATCDAHLALGDVNTFIRECTLKAGMDTLKVYHDANGFSITSSKEDKPAIKKQAALELLVFNHGIKLEEADIMLKEAADHGVAPRADRYLVKYAGILDMSTDMGSIGYTQSTPQETNEIVTPAEMTALAVKASDTGLKEVLDTSVIASLVGTTRTMGKVGEFVPDLIKAMDRLGSILCLYYWDNDEFEEQYGRADIRELEEKLIDVFNSLGDITLFLKEKTTSDDSIFDGDKGNISENMGDE